MQRPLSLCKKIPLIESSQNISVYVRLLNIGLHSYTCNLGEDYRRGRPEKRRERGLARCNSRLIERLPVSPVQPQLPANQPPLDGIGGALKVIIPALGVLILFLVTRPSARASMKLDG